MLDTNVLAANIKKHRKLCCITQNELASRLYVSPQSISKWECGISVPELFKLCEMADMFGVTVDTLIGNTKAGAHKKCMIAIDGGGTKTEFVLIDETGSIIRRLVLGCSNPASCGVEHTCALLKEGIDTLLDLRTDISGIYAGISGASGGDPEQKIPSFLKENYPEKIIGCDTDVPNVIASTINPDDEIDSCVAVICGTGSVAFTYNNGSCVRTGGWGNLLDTAGSGYDFGREALCAALSEKDGLGRETLITPMVEARLGGDVWDNISKVYTDDKGYIASFAPIVFDAYTRGDKIAADIIQKGTDRLAELTERAAANLKDGSLVVISGGLMAYKDILVEQIKSKVHKKLKYVVPELPQIYGAAVLCAKLCGFTGNMFLKNFKNDYKKIINKKR